MLGTFEDAEVVKESQKSKQASGSRLQQQRNSSRPQLKVYYAVWTDIERNLFGEKKLAMHVVNFADISSNSIIVTHQYLYFCLNPIQFFTFFQKNPDADLPFLSTKLWSTSEWLLSWIN